MTARVIGARVRVHVRGRGTHAHDVFHAGVAGRDQKLRFFGKMRGFGVCGYEDFLDFVREQPGACDFGVGVLEDLDGGEGREVQGGGGGGGAGQGEDFLLRREVRGEVRD